jgi:GntR family transcriptional regulator of vanillate catabolism
MRHGAGGPDVYNGGRNDGPTPMSGETNVTQAVRAQRQLRESILAGDLPAGARLLEVPLAERLAISRTPIRDALARLAEEGLLDRVRGGGFVVRTFSLGDVFDAIELRGVLEGTAARLAAERGAQPARLNVLAGVVVALDSALSSRGGEFDMELYTELNERFHELLWDLAGSAIVQREIARVARLPFGSPSSFLQGMPGDAGFVRSNSPRRSTAPWWRRSADARAHGPRRSRASTPGSPGATSSFRWPTALRAGCRASRWWSRRSLPQQTIDGGVLGLRCL